MFINLAAFLERSLVNGPGERAVVWVQGCPIRCKGCFNTEMWSFELRMPLTVDELAERILQIDGIEGVTFSGGEPFAQADALGGLGEILKSRSAPRAGVPACGSGVRARELRSEQERGLNIVTFTGYTLEHLRSVKRPDWMRLLAVTDLLIAGPFIQKQRCALPLRGSTNQRLIFLTDRLQNHPDLGGEMGRATEFIIEPDGTIAVTGFPNSDVVGLSADFLP